MDEELAYLRRWAMSEFNNRLEAQREYFFILNENLIERRVIWSL